MHHWLASYVYIHHDVGAGMGLLQCRQSAAAGRLGLLLGTRRCLLPRCPIDAPNRAVALFKEQLPGPLALGLARMQDGGLLLMFATASTMIVQLCRHAWVGTWYLVLVPCCHPRSMLGCIARSQASYIEPPDSG